MKEEAQEFLEQHKIRELVKKYSQFINFDIYLWDSKVSVMLNKFLLFFFKENIIVMIILYRLCKKRCH